MKKILAILASLTMCLSFAACGEEKKDESSAKTESSSVAEVSSEEAVEESSEKTVEESSEEEDSEEAEETGAEVTTGSYESVQAFIDGNQETFDAFKESLAGSGLSMEILARGNSLVYSYQYTDTSIQDTEEMKTALESSMESQKETFNTVLSSVQLAVPSTESVIVEYFDSEGDIIATFEFK